VCDGDNRCLSIASCCFDIHFSSASSSSFSASWAFFGSSTVGVDGVSSASVEGSFNALGVLGRSSGPAVWALGCSFERGDGDSTGCGRSPWVEAPQPMMAFRARRNTQNCTHREIPM